MTNVPRVALILAGGSGERFWPLSTGDTPKQLLSLTGSGKTLLQEAVERIRPIFPEGQIYIGTGERIGPALRDAGLVPADNVLIEPAPKNTLGALCWAVSELHKRGIGEDTLMAVLTADHAIGEPERFRATVDEALRVAATTEGLITIGITPTRPEIGYGYIRCGDGTRAAGFTEKPDLATAESYAASGEYLWNSGMFFWRIDAFERELGRHCPHAASFLAGGLDFADLASEPVDRALMERSSEVHVVPGAFPWDDVGAWDALARLYPLDAAGNASVGEVAMLDCSNSIVFSDGFPIGVIGVEDLIVVATANGVLVCPKSQAQRVKEIVARMRYR